MKLRSGDPWMPAPVYGRSLIGLTVNLLVRDVEGGAAVPARGPWCRGGLC